MLGHGVGPIPTRIMLVGEAWGEQEEHARQPFVGASGQELNRMLQEAGIMRSECYVTNVVNARPPNNYLGAWIATKKKDITPAHKLLRDKYCLPIVHEGYAALLAEIEMVQPNIIVAFGNFSMWALTGNWGILKWRGSLLQHNPYTEVIYKIPGSIDRSATLKAAMKETFERPKVIPTIHPASVLREWSQRAVVLNDLRRVKRHMASRTYDNRPAWQFKVRPTIADVSLYLFSLLNALNADATNWDCWIDFDIETVGGHIDCIGLSHTRTEAICIPFITRGNREGYWSAGEEAHIVWLLYKILTHPKVKIRWQNGLYDAQYVYRHWHFIPRGVQDTMISQHSMFAALPKGLSFLASMYADWYVYWKDEGKIASGEPEEKRWTYNLQDCVYTREVGEVLTESLKAMGLSQVDAWQQELFWPVLRAMLRGVKVRPEIKNQMALDIQEELSHREAFLYNVLGHSINPRSPLQMQALFYDDLKQPPILKRTVIQGKTVMRPTCDDEALTKIAAREPILRPLCNAIADIRTLEKFLNDFVMMPLDEDGRMRCSFNIAGDAGGKSAPYSYRLSSSKNPFGSGGNLQTIPSEKSKSANKAATRGSMEFTLPNIRAMYGPDQGFTFFDMDLDRADLQVVVRESGEKDWIAAMDMGVDMHLLNVYILDKQSPPPMEELIESHPKYLEHRTPRRAKREFAKTFVHATNYGGQPRTVSAHTGRSIQEVEHAQALWFGAHPGIRRWHDRTLDQITRHRFVENRFGYRWYIFDRLDGLLPEALAWVPQSTVGIVINKIWVNFHRELPEVQTLLQVHDSLAGQFPTHRKEYLLPKMRECSRIRIPYDDLLIIPTGIKCSETSWGDCA